MRPKRAPARSLDDCLKADSGLARLSAHANRLMRLQRLFEAATPLARQSRIANLKLGKVVIHAANGAVAAKLRQMEPRLAAVFRCEAAEVTGIEIRVQPAGGQRPAIRPAISAAIGTQQKHALTSLANGLPEGSELKAALERLVSRSKGR
jgi:hypothetical protein